LNSSGVGLGGRGGGRVSSERLVEKPAERSARRSRSGRRRTFRPSQGDDAGAFNDKQLAVIVTTHTIEVGKSHEAKKLIDAR